MKFKLLSDEKVIYEEGDWKLTIATTLGIIFVHKFNYSKDMFLCCAYIPSSSNYLRGDISIAELPDNMKDEILKEVM